MYSFRSFLQRLQRALKDKSVTQAERDGLQKVYDALAEGKPAREILPFLSEDELADVGRLGLLTGMLVWVRRAVSEAHVSRPGDRCRKPQLAQKQARLSTHVDFSSLFSRNGR